jgi:hypothetical protein
VQGASWGIEDLRSRYEQMDNQILGERLSAILDWANSSGALLTGYRDPNFHLRSRYGKTLMEVKSSGKVLCNINADQHFNGDSENRDEFVKRLNALPMFEYDVEEIAYGKNSAGLLTDLSDVQFEELMRIIETFCASQ